MWSSEDLEGTPERYQNLVLWVWHKFIFTLNSKTKLVSIIFSGITLIKLVILDFYSKTPSGTNYELLRHHPLQTLTKFKASGQLISSLASCHSPGNLLLPVSLLLRGIMRQFAYVGKFKARGGRRSPRALFSSPSNFSWGPL